MALTIHYQFGFRGSEAQLLDKLKWLSVEFLKLPISKVGEISNGRRGYELAVEVGPGCEWFTVALGRNDNDEWRGRGFTKTAYADDFKACHTAVVAMLDLCKQAGILDIVHDESTYWESRDSNVLK